MTNQQAREMLDEIKEATKDGDKNSITLKVISLIEYLYNKLNT